MNKFFYIIFFIFVLASLNPETYIYKKFYINYDQDIPKDNIFKIRDALDKAEDFFVYKFSIVPKSKLDFFIFNSVNEMMEKLKTASWVGAYYNDGNVYLQPVEVLIRKNVFEKVIFIEYAHYYLNDFSMDETPAWMNEMLSAYYFMQYKNESLNFKENLKPLNKFSDFTAIKNIFKDYEYSRSFYYHSYLFISFLNKKYNNFFENILNELHEGGKFENAVYKITGKKIEYLYEKEFIVQLER